MIILNILFSAFSLFQIQNFCGEYKIETNYIIQEVTYGYGANIYPQFVRQYRLKTDGDVYYITNRKYILNAIRKDSINLDSLTILIPQNRTWEMYDSISDKYRSTINYSMDLYDVMTMDNTEVYKIGGKYYAIKKIKYGYSDEIELFRNLYNIMFMIIRKYVMSCTAGVRKPVDTLLMR